MPTVTSQTLMFLPCLFRGYTDQKLQTEMLKGTKSITRHVIREKKVAETLTSIEGFQVTGQRIRE